MQARPAVIGVHDLNGTGVQVGSVQFTADELKRWAPWNRVESAIKALKRPLMAGEWEVLKKYAVDGGANGFKELQSALGQAERLEAYAREGLVLKEAADRCKDLLATPESGVDFENISADCARDLFRLARAAVTTKD